MLPNVKQKTIKPIIEAMVVKGTMIYTDEYSIYARLPGTRSPPPQHRLCH